jgi:serine/threonine-protein kinase
VIEPGAILLNKYRVLEEIGRGGMGSVWLVEHLGLGEKRALKVINALVAADPKVRARFRQEAKILAKLKHDNAVTVHDTGITGQVAFIEMEYLEGPTLRELMKPGKPLPISTIMWLLKQLCDVLNRAHALGIVHRDLKPEKLMMVTDLSSGQPELKVLDFGIAKIVQEGADESSGVTLNTEGPIGTLAYASPEQNDIDPDTRHRLAIDGRSDIYSVGVILFEMLTGSRPFKGRQAQLLFEHARVEPPSFKKVAPELDIPPAVEAIVRQCLEKSPEKRPQTARQLLDDINRAIGEMITKEEPFRPNPLVEPPPTVMPTPIATTRRLPVWLTGWRAAMLGCVLVLAAGGLIAWITSSMWINGSVKPPPTPTSGPEVSTEILNFLKLHRYRPVDGTGLSRDGWPEAVTGIAGEPRTLYLKGRVYLPEGYEPESGKTDGRVPKVVKSQYGTRFILIPGDEFMMGAFHSRDPFVDDERPSHPVKLSTFYMQENETTIEEFDRFCQETIRGRGDPDLANYPKVRASLLKDVAGNLEDCRRRPASGVSHGMATFYARKMGGELPTEAQWEFAARSGGKQNLHVWGEAQDPVFEGKINIDKNLELKINTLDVGTVDLDSTSQGVHDLAGNVREWTRDVKKPYGNLGPVQDPVQRADGGETPRYAIRGGSYLTTAETARVTYRSDFPEVEYSAPDSDSFPDVGFRIVLEVLVADLPPAGEKSAAGKVQESPR